MYDNRFTPRAQGALQQAQAAAQELGHSYVGSEHLLLGILRQEGAASRCLAQQQITVEKVRTAVVQAVGAGLPGLAPPQGLTPCCRAVIGHAAEEALRQGSGPVGTEHLLLGILREPAAVALGILHSLGADSRRLQNALRQRMSASPRLPRESPRPQPTREEPARSRQLEQFTRSLNALAREGRLDPVVGREREIARTIRILSRRTKNNPVLVGEPGVGKTAVVEALAQRIVQEDVPEELRGVTILSIDLAAMLAGTKYRGEFEERVRSAVQEIRRMGNVILFIDELHTIVGAGSAEGAVDAANLLKPALSRGDLRVIGATTAQEYRRYIEKDAALERRFQPVQVAEPSRETAVEILLGLREKYELHHRLSISDGALQAAVDLGLRYLPDRFLPDKAIDLMDEACARVRLEGADPDRAQLTARLAQVRREKAAALAVQDRPLAVQLAAAEESFSHQLQACTIPTASPAVTQEDIAAVAAEWTGIPLQRLTEDESARLLRLEEELKRRVVGQDAAVQAVARAIRRGRVGLKEPHRPVGSFLLLGPTGVGKTELCRALAQSLFGREDAMIRLDMSEFSQGHAASRLVGSPPGYVGHEEGGQLTDQVRRRPWSLVLFDEIEKAHQEVWDLLLQIMEEGCLTDSHGRRVDFRNTVVVMTSNTGAREIAGGGSPLGFSGLGIEEDRQGRVRQAVDDALRRTFRPEFLNRIDETIVFRQLSEADLREIAGRMLRATGDRLQGLGLSLTWTEEALSALAREGFHRTYGARPLRRLIRSRVEDPVAEGLLSGEYRSGDHLRLLFTESLLEIRRESE